MSHTKGRWRADGRYKDYITVYGNSTPIAKVIGRNQGRDIDEHLANARLIAAAPDMLRALENLENDNGKMMPESAWEWVQEAIAKARGEA